MIQYGLMERPWVRRPVIVADRFTVCVGGITCVNWPINVMKRVDKHLLLVITFGIGSEHTVLSTVVALVVVARKTTVVASARPSPTVGARLTMAGDQILARALPGCDGRLGVAMFATMRKSPFVRHGAYTNSKPPTFATPLNFRDEWRQVEATDVE